MSDTEFFFWLRVRCYTSVALCWIALRMLHIGDALVAIAQRVEPDL